MPSSEILCFTGEDTEAQMLSSLPKVTQLLVAELGSELSIRCTTPGTTMAPLSSIHTGLMVSHHFLFGLHQQALKSCD